jgi:hypothetical protein
MIDLSLLQAAKAGSDWCYGSYKKCIRTPHRRRLYRRPRCSFVHSHVALLVQITYMLNTDGPQVPFEITISGTMGLETEFASCLV